MKRNLLVWSLVVMYLGAIVAANLISTHYGPSASIYNAFFLVVLSLTSRDALQDFWGDSRVQRYARLGALILAGSALSWIVSANAAQVAKASAISFAAAAVVDTIVYTLLERRSWLERSNVSNVFGAAVDSIVFPTLAFGGFMWSISFGQFTAKVAGGFLWSLLLGYAIKRYHSRGERVPVAWEGSS